MKNRALLLLVIWLLWNAPSRAAQAVNVDPCWQAFNKLRAQKPTEFFPATVVKIKSDSSKIYRITTEDGLEYFYREFPKSQNEERMIFDNTEMAAVASAAAKNLGIGQNVAYAKSMGGMNLLVDGKQIRTRAGVLQAGFDNLVTPLDDFARIHPGVKPQARDIQAILNQGEWPRLYADWKIFWRIFHQVDMSIQNLARDGRELRMFDLGDLLNFHAIRNRMGIRSDIQNLHFNMPGEPWNEAEFRADFRLADPAFKELARTIAMESDAATAARLELPLEYSFAAPRGKVLDHVHEMKEEAKRILELLDKAPFDY